MSRTQDRNFDDLAERFEQKVYSTVKGDWRLKLIREDLDFLCKQPVLQVWDAGCGHARIGQWLAQNGHRLTLCDISENMLQRARKNFEQAGLHAEFHHRSAQSLAGQLAEFDLVLCHAVIEWLAE